MKTVKKTLLLSIVAIFMAFSVLAGCSSTDNASSGNGETENNNTSKDQGKKEDNSAVLGEQPLEFSFYGNYDWYTMPPWGEDLATKWIKENKKVNIIPVSSGGNATQKLNTMIVSSELPDVIWMERGADVERLRAAGMLVPLDDYIDKYPNLKKWAGESTLNMLRSEDGKIYQFPNWYSSQPAGNAGYVVNKKIYEGLGSPKLETVDDLYSYLKQVKAKYPDVVPFEPHIGAQGVDILYSAFAEDHPPSFIGMRAVPNGNELKSIFTDPVFRESTQFASKLFREKLISQDSLTQTSDQVKEKVTTGRVAVFASSSPTSFGVMGDLALKKKDPNDGYFMIWPIHKENLDRNKIWTGSWNQLGWNVSVVTKAAKNPEEIFAFLDWMTGPEGQRVIFWGPEGLYWEGTDGEDAPKFTEKYTTDIEGRDTLMNTTNSFQWVGNTVYIDRSKSKFEMSLPLEKRKWEAHWQAEITWKTHYNGTQFVNLNPMPDSEEGIVAQRVNDIYTEARAKALYAKSDEEVLAILDQAEKDAQDAGYSKLLEFKTKKWEENLQKMKGDN
jgi:putative aldouronate transport system substrate-binding protein